jgi:hypothetical protein
MIDDRNHRSKIQARSKKFISARDLRHTDRDNADGASTANTGQVAAESTKLRFFLI